MLANVVDVDFHAMKISLRHPHGAIVLFDFEAAFPSVSQEFMWETLGHIGLPDDLLRAIKRLYVDNLHHIRVKGRVFPSFTATSGVRQGCPLSPLLFAVIADVLLKRLAEDFPDSITRAFADDTCMICPSFARDATQIMSTFHEFAAISNLKLNIGKTVLIPLWESSTFAVKRWLHECFPLWSSVEVSWSARYLGFLVGPGKNTGSWDNARTKFQDRVRKWSSLHLGQHFNSKVYRTFCTSTLAFYWQLEELPLDILEEEKSALRKLAPGPGNWIGPEELRHLQHCFSHPFSFPCFKHMALAAKLRVASFEPDLHVEARARDLDMSLAFPAFVRPSWQQWYEQSHVFVLRRACRQASQVSISQQSVCHAISEQVPHLSGTRLANHVKKHFQAKALEQILSKERYNHEAFLRGRLERWRLQEAPIGIMTRRSVQRLTKIFSLTTVRVGVVIFRTWLNGWCTARRFQHKDSKCVFNCECAFSEDSIEHYAFCPIIRRFATQHLHLSANLVGAMCPFLCLNRYTNDSTLIVQCLLTYATYTASNRIRFGGINPASICMNEFLMQIMCQGAFNHSSHKVMNNLYALGGAAPPVVLRHSPGHNRRHLDIDSSTHNHRNTRRRLDTGMMWVRGEDLRVSS